MEGYVSRFGENGRVGGGWINSPEGTGSKYKVREVARGGKWSENDRKSGCAERKDVHFHYIGSANGGLCEKLGFTDFGGSVGTETAFSSWRHDPFPCVDSTQSLCGLHTDTVRAGGRRRGRFAESLEARDLTPTCPAHTHTPKIANPRCGWKRTRALRAPVGSGVPFWVWVPGEGPGRA